MIDISVGKVSNISHRIQELEMFSLEMFQWMIHLGHLRVFNLIMITTIEYEEVTDDDDDDQTGSNVWMNEWTNRGSIQKSNNLVAIDREI